MSKKSQREGKFDLLVEKFVADGTFSLEDAKKPLNLIITEKHVEIAETCDESYCVIAQAITDSQVTCLAASVGEAITKLLFDTGKVVRYNTPTRLKRALDRWDKFHDWSLPFGVYTLPVPSDGNKLWKNQSEETVKRRKKAWDAFSQRFKSNGGKGNKNNLGGRGDGLLGGSRHRGRPIDARQITTLTVGGRTGKRGDRTKQNEPPTEATE